MEIDIFVGLTMLAFAATVALALGVRLAQARRARRLVRVQYNRVVRRRSK